MIRFVLYKIKNKKWLNLCLLVGISLLAAVFTCHPMLENGSANRLLRTGFAEYVEENRKFPAVISKDGQYKTTECPDSGSVYENLEAQEKGWLERIKAYAVVSQKYLKLPGSSSSSNLGSKSRMTSIACLSGLKEHAVVSDGVWADEYKTEEGEYACVVSESVSDEMGFIVGEKITFDHETDSDGKQITLVVAGIIKEASATDSYWETRLSDMTRQVFVTEDVLDSLITRFAFETVVYGQRLMLDYTMINSRNASEHLESMKMLSEEDDSLELNAVDILREYESRRNTVRTILWVLELPCVVLLMLFIYMVSSQILGSEAGEIAVLRSRGVTRRQTLRLYLLQSFILSFAGLIFGTGLGFVLCRCAASTDAFLKFTVKDVSMYNFVWEMIPFGAAACLFAVLFMTLPVLKKSRITIVEYKSEGFSFKSRPFWEKYFIDIILLGISAYLLYNYNKQSEAISLSILEGNGLDPVIFLDSSLFIFACGLVLLRLTRYIVILVNRIGQKHWKAPSYASFIQIIRTYAKQGFISVFLVMTIAIGIFQANMARTVNENNEERIRYNVGTDVRMEERWRKYAAVTGPGQGTWVYVEPDFGRYRELADEGLCESAARVIEDDRTMVKMGTETIRNCMLMGIHTKEFGETARLADGLNDSHWFNALNALAAKPEGIIISRNMAEDYSLDIGQRISYMRYNPSNSGGDLAGTAVAEVVAIIDAFPGYERYRYQYDEDGNFVRRENYLLVGNYAQIVSSFDVFPYSVWIRLSENADSARFKEILEEKGIGINKWKAIDSEISESRSDALIQITNGMFTMSFIISILICVTGFLIYWIMSIKSREMQFGIYRAMGMRMSGIRKMLVNEQIFGSLLPMLAGGGAGMLSTFLFAKLIAVVYLPESHNIAVRIFTDISDVVKIFAVVLAAVLICFIVIRQLLKNMKIAQALKLGED